MNTSRNVHVEDSWEDRQERKPTLASLPVVETDFAESEDGSLIEMIEDPEDSSRSPLAIWKNGVVHVTDRFQCRDQILVPIPRDRHIVKHIRLPQGTKPYESAIALMTKVRLILSQCLELDEYAHLLSAFVLSTWFIDQLPVAPYVSLVGLPRSGKSTTLSLDYSRILW